MIMTVIDRAPDLLGRELASAIRPNELVRCCAWELIVPQPDAERLVCGWIIHAPYAHPVWSNYTLECIHLRPNGRKLIMYLEGATHEFVLWALKPGSVPVLDEANKVLHPKNFAAQFIAQSDEHARVLLKQAVQDVVDGYLNPDSDYIRMWAKRFGDNMMRN